MTRAVLRNLSGVLGALLLVVQFAANAQDIAAGERKYGICASCHGIEGRSVKIHYPILAGQDARYLFEQLNDFKQGRRHDPSMDTVIEWLDVPDMLDLAAFFASRKSPLGSRLRRAGTRAAPATAACTACHSGGAQSGKDTPRILGQHRDYLVKQLRDFRDGRRTNGSGAMQRATHDMSDDDIEQATAYFTGHRETPARQGFAVGGTGRSIARN